MTTCTLRLTQHKRFVPFGTHPNFAFGKTSFMLEPLGDTRKKKERFGIRYGNCQFDCADS